MSLTITVTLDQSRLAGLLRRLAPAEQQRRMQAAMSESVQLGVRRVVARTSKRTGALAASVAGEAQSGVRGIIRSPLHYAPFVEEGTHPHVIVPRQKKALAWPGGLHPVRSVHHPGTRGFHMFRDTGAEMGPLMTGIFVRHLAAP